MELPVAQSVVYFVLDLGCATGEHSSEAPKDLPSTVTSKPSAAEVSVQPFSPTLCSTAARSIEDFNRERDQQIEVYTRWQTFSS